MFFVLFSLSQLVSQGFSGTIYLRDGSAISFSHLGDLNSVENAHVAGKMGPHSLNYRLEELKEIIFVDKTKYYSRISGEIASAIIINKDGEQFTLDDCTFYGNWRNQSSAGYIYFVTIDPITKQLKRNTLAIRNNVYRVVVGEDIGNIKLNPKTSQFFPPYYNFDPYTGQKLIWAKRE